jgi:hypothetical protein
MWVGTGLNSGLGPSTLTCDVTGQPIRMGRREWSQMGPFRKCWYCLVSLMYAAIFALWGILITFGAVRPYLDDSNRPDPPAFRALFGVVFAVFLAAGLAVQVNRVRRSLRRTTKGITLTHRAARAGLSLQITTLVLMIVLGVAIVMGSQWIRTL